MFSVLSQIAERRINEAIESGTLRTESWKNRPLPLEDETYVPDDLKMAYKILKNSGYIPPEIETRKEIHKLEDLIRNTEDEHQRVKQMKKLNVLLMKLDGQRHRPASIDHDDEYYRKIVEKVTLRSDGSSESK